MPKLIFACQEKIPTEPQRRTFQKYRACIHTHTHTHTQERERERIHCVPQRITK